MEKELKTFVFDASVDPKDACVVLMLTKSEQVIFKSRPVIKPDYPGEFIVETSLLPDALHRIEFPLPVKSVDIMILNNKLYEITKPVKSISFNPPLLLHKIKTKLRSKVTLVCRSYNDIDVKDNELLSSILRPLFVYSIYDDSDRIDYEFKTKLHIKYMNGDSEKTTMDFTNMDY